jgi:hypothetical protein
VTLTKDKQSPRGEGEALGVVHVFSFVVVCADNGVSHVAFGTSGKTPDTSQNGAREHPSHNGTLIVRVICRKQRTAILWHESRALLWRQISGINSALTFFWVI